MNKSKKRGKFPQLESSNNLLIYIIDGHHLIDILAFLEVLLKCANDKKQAHSYLQLKLTPEQAQALRNSILINLVRLESKYIKELDEYSFLNVVANRAAHFASTFDLDYDRYNDHFSLTRPEK